MSTGSMSVLDNVRFAIEVTVRRNGYIRLDLKPALPQRSNQCNERKMAAVIYRLASEFEYRIAALGAEWRVSVAPYHQNLEIQPDSEEDADFVAELVQTTLDDLELDREVYDG